MTLRVIRGGKKGRVRGARAISMAVEMGEENYSTSQFHVPSHDAQGHAVKITTMVTPDTKREIQTILARRSVPHWSTEGDLIRWCLAEGMRTLAKRISDPHVRSAHAMTNSWIEIQRELQESQYWGETVFPMMRKQLALNVKGGHYIPALKLLRVIEPMVETIGDEYWRKRFSKDLVEAYQWVKAKAKAQELKMKREEEDE